MCQEKDICNFILFMYFKHNGKSSTKNIYLHSYIRTVLFEGQTDEACEPSNKLKFFLSAGKVSLTCLFPLLCYYILCISLSTSLGISGAWTLGNHVRGEVLEGVKKLNLSVLVGLNLLIFNIGLVVNTGKKKICSIREENSLNNWTTTFVHSLCRLMQQLGASLFVLTGSPLHRFSLGLELS